MIKRVSPVKKLLAYGSVLLVFACIELRDHSPSYRLQNVGAATNLSLMTFNILSNVDLVGLSEGYERWVHRKSDVFRTIDEAQPDLEIGRASCRERV